jgi:hypothetical protein
VRSVSGFNIAATHHEPADHFWAKGEDPASAAEVRKQTFIKLSRYVTSFELLHPQTQGKIERWHQTLENRILLETTSCSATSMPDRGLRRALQHRRYLQSLNNVTPADAYFGGAPAIIKQRQRIRRQTIEHRRLQHRKLAA